jgi:hypothetical protein
VTLQNALNSWNLSTLASVRFASVAAPGRMVLDPDIAQARRCLKWLSSRDGTAQKRLQDV